MQKIVFIAQFTQHNERENNMLMPILNIRVWGVIKTQLEIDVHFMGNTTMYKVEDYVRGAVGFCRHHGDYGVYKLMVNGQPKATVLGEHYWKRRFTNFNRR